MTDARVSGRIITAWSIKEDDIPEGMAEIDLVNEIKIYLDCMMPHDADASINISLIEKLEFDGVEIAVDTQKI